MELPRLASWAPYQLNYVPNLCFDILLCDEMDQLFM